MTLLTENGFALVLYLSLAGIALTLRIALEGFALVRVMTSELILFRRSVESREAIAGSLAANCSSSPTDSNVPGELESRSFSPSEFTSEFIATLTPKDAARARAAIEMAKRFDRRCVITFLPSLKKLPDSVNKEDAPNDIK
ncbi:hypothetical protein [Herbaspirillum autotrophicum]|uniref:hypothetical protein n=1 Tax=Herbaspirillum autotrophicum TaxID=180195 RepID=UPI000A6EC8B2|nr:hypothetical protein [Herbaspirillum autotrophicum]